MRVGIFIIEILFFAWQIKSDETTSVTRNEKDEKGPSGRDREHLYPPPLVSPFGGTLKLLMGIAMPIPLSGGRTLVFGSNFQFQFPIPQNATFFTKHNNIVTGRMTRRWKRTSTSARNVIEKPDESRSIFYRSLELEFERWGENGRDCLLRSICEAAETSLKDQGLVGELLDIMLTPDYAMKKNVTTDEKKDDYLQASLAGRTGKDCSIIYPACPEGNGLLDRITNLDYTPNDNLSNNF